MRQIRRGTLTVVVSMLLASGMGCTMDMADVSPEAKNAIETRFPQATVTQVEGKLGNRYEITLTQGTLVADVELHRDGTIIEVETTIAASELPKAVADTVAEKAKDHELVKVERVEQMARRTGGRLETLETPEVYYEVKWRSGGFMRELEINPDGTIR